MTPNDERFETRIPHVTDRRKEAEAAHNRGWVLTALNGKIPIIHGWQKRPAPSLDQLLQWAERGNLGLRTGKVSGVFVVDVDTGGDVGDLALPDTVTAITGRGGRHLYFRAPDPCPGNSASKLAPHVDTRGEGGQVVYIGSVHPQTHEIYRWADGLTPDDIGLADLPADVLTLLVDGPRAASSSGAPGPPGSGAKQPAAPSSTSKYADAALEGECKAVREAPETTRNDTLNRASFSLGQLVGGGALDRGTVERELEAAADGCGLLRDDGAASVRATIRSGVTSGMQQPREAPEPRARSTSVSRPEPADNATEARDYFMSDAGNAERIVHEHGHDLIHVRCLGAWYVWSGRHWPEDTTGETVRRAMKTMRKKTVESLSWPDTERNKRIAHALKSEGAQRIHSALGLAGVFQGVAHTPTDLDRDPWWLNVPNGTLDLRTGDLREHRREDLLTKLCPTAYDATATAPRFERFLLEIMGGDVGLCSYLQRVFGYALTGTCRENILLMLIGGGANGKSTLTTTLLRVTGSDYSVQLAPGLLFQTQKDTHPTGLADLRGKRIAVTHELDSGTRLAEGTVKSITGGDPIRARRMRQDYFEFDPTHTVFLCANSRPVIHGTDDGIWRRVRLVPFRVQIPLERQDTQLTDRLVETEAPGILAWLVAGARDWHEHGLEDPDSVRTATAAYRSEQDVLGDFLDAECVLDDQAFVPAMDLYARFSTWCQRNGSDPWKQTTFGRRLTDRGLEPKKVGGMRCRVGVSLQ